MIQVEKNDDGTFEVTVEGSTTTQHTVTVEAAYARKLTGGKVDAAELVRKSFEFLLERESNTSILRRFELPMIHRFFPEYERVIAQSFG